LSLAVFGALLVAALLHALWNAFVRRAVDRAAGANAVAAGGIVVGFVLLPFLPAMSPAAIPYVLLTSIIHVAYFFLIGRAYRHNELSVAYPIMRGLAPVIATALAVAVEIPPSVVILGIAVTGAGIVSLSLQRLHQGFAILVPALLNAVVIACYTLVDGLGARVSAAPLVYTAWILVGGGCFTIAVQYLVRGAAIVTDLRPLVAMGIAGGALSYAAYAIALWAMTFTAIGAVAAVRESSVLFATAIGALALKERFGWARWAAAALVAVGLAMVKFGGAA
jgi:drug/metabolite transporter (DMT)-like permease